MKVIILCLILAVAYADHHIGGSRGQTGQTRPGVYHEAGHANQGNQGRPTIGGYPGTYHGPQTSQPRPGVYHEAGHANQGNQGRPVIGGYPGTYHGGQGGQGGRIGATHQGGYQTHGY